MPTIARKERYRNEWVFPPVHLRCAIEMGTVKIAVDTDICTRRTGLDQGLPVACVSGNLVALQRDLEKMVVDYLHGARWVLEREEGSP